MDKRCDCNFSETIKQIRKSKKLSQQKFADIIEVTLNTVQNWEYTRSLPTRANTQRIIEACNLSEEDYPALFAYASGADSSAVLKGCAASDGEELKDKNLNNTPLKKIGKKITRAIKNLFSHPLKVALICAIVLLALIGLAVVIYFIYDGTMHGLTFFGDSTLVLLIVLIFLLLSPIIASLIIYFYKKRHKK